MLSNNSLYEDSLITCQITPNCHGSLLHSLVNVQLASRNPLLRTDCCWLGSFCKAYWATPFKMRFDCCLLLRRTFAELTRKYPYPQTPDISRGRIRGKENTRGLGVWLSQSLTFGSFAAAFGACFLRLQKATLAVPAAGARMCFKTAVFGCGEASHWEAWLLPMKGKVNVRYHSPAGPPGGRWW
jgi:hypothetical protein